MTIDYTALTNGMGVISEHIDHVESVSLGIWLKKGSRHEPARQNGMFHFIEHTLFKGTPSRSAREIAEAFDGIGGTLDAYTGKEETCYFIRVRGKHLDQGLDILADMLSRPVFKDEELDRERQVILEEIRMVEDTPEDMAFEKCLQHFWQGHAMGRPILGSPKNLNRFSQAETHAFHKEHYRLGDMVCAVAGNVNHRHLTERLEELFEHSDMRGMGSATVKPPQNRAFQTYIPSDHFEQVHFLICFPGLYHTHNQIAVIGLLSTVLGGGMSSRLFQSVREERGLAYNIGSFSSSYSDCGHLSVYGACSPGNFEQTLGLCLKEIDRLKNDGITLDELARAKEQVIGNLTMGLENTYQRAAALAKRAITHQEIFDLDKTVAKIEGILAGEIMETARQCLIDDEMGILALGALPKKPTTRWSIGH